MADLALQASAHLLNLATMVLFLAEFLSNAGGISHGLLGMLLSSLQLTGLVLKIGLVGTKGMVGYQYIDI